MEVVKENLVAVWLLTIMAVFTNQGLREIARFVLGKDLHLSLAAHLFINELTPDVTDILAQYAECALGGYTFINLNSNQWVEHSQSGYSEFVYPVWTTTFTAYGGPRISIYGYYLRNIVTNHLVMADEFLIPYDVPHGGGKLPVTISFKISNCVC